MRDLDLYVDILITEAFPELAPVPYYAGYGGAGERFIMTDVLSPWAGYELIVDPDLQDAPSLVLEGGLAYGLQSVTRALERQHRSWWHRAKACFREWSQLEEQRIANTYWAIHERGYGQQLGAYLVYATHRDHLTDAVHHAALRRFQQQIDRQEKE